jgi:hypothetical protein
VAWRTTDGEKEYARAREAAGERVREEERKRQAAEEAERKRQEQERERQDQEQESRKRMREEELRQEVERLRQEKEYAEQEAARVQQAWEQWKQDHKFSRKVKRLVKRPLFVGMLGIIVSIFVLTLITAPRTEGTSVMVSGVPVVFANARYECPSTDQQELANFYAISIKDGKTIDNLTMEQLTAIANKANNCFYSYARAIKFPMHIEDVAHLYVYHSVSHLAAYSLSKRWVDDFNEYQENNSPGHKKGQ